MNNKYDKRWIDLILKYAWDLDIKGWRLRRSKRRWARALRKFQEENKSGRSTPKEK